MTNKKVIGAILQTFWNTKLLIIFYVNLQMEPMMCTEPLGLAADLPIENIEVSSNNDARKLFKLDGERGWKPIYSTPGEWIMV
jgi:hypothetical protein